jgi:ketosteroid isomerase-like protein
MTDTPTTRTPAETALLRNLELLTDGRIEDWVHLFTADGVLEFPYAPPGWPTHIQGHAALHEHMRRFPEHLAVRFSGVRFHPVADPHLVVAEFDAEGTALSTGRSFQQSYISLIWTGADGLITRYRDFWNPLRLLEALGGVEAATRALES